MRPFASLFSDGVEPDAPASPAQRRRRRAEILRESPGRRLARLCADLNHALHPRLLLRLPGAVDFLMRGKGVGIAGLPEPRCARRTPDGLAGFAQDLSPATVVEAYGRGLFLRWILGNATYWAPQQRMAARPGDVTADAGVEALLAGNRLRITLDRDFDAVVNAATKCAVDARRPFAPSIRGMHAFAALHDAGFAHSVEIRDRAGALAGGLYGVACGRVFMAQARFGRTRALADLACVALARHLADWGFDMIDGCADASLAPLGFAALERDEHLAALPQMISGGRPGRWLVTPALLG